MTIRVDFSQFVEYKWTLGDWEELLNQDEEWMDRWGNRHKISEMSTRHLKNIIDFIKGAALRIAESNTLITLDPFMSEMNRDMFDREAYRFMMWEELPLTRAVRKELAKRHDK